jgi:glycosyltransferase involved in cell wall biosynthesis
MARSQAETPPLVSVIVPVLNGAHTIEACIAGLLAVDYPVDRREILIVDNGSTDRTAEVVRPHPVRYLREPTRGAAAARNRGVAASSGCVLAFTDADCRATRGWLSELVAGFSDERVGAVEGEILDYPPASLAQRYTASRRSYSHEVRRMSPFAPYLCTGNVAFRREVFARIGPFDVQFTGAGGEDVDFSWRFFESAGLEACYRPKAAVFHEHRRTVADLFFQQVRNGRGLATLQRKYPGRLPWGWKRELRVWWKMAGFSLTAVRAVLGRPLGGTEADTLYPGISLMRKLGFRLGYLAGVMARRR